MREIFDLEAQKMTLNAQAPYRPTRLVQGALSIENVFPAFVFSYIIVHYIILVLSGRYTSSPLDEFVSLILFGPGIMYIIYRKDFIPITLFLVYAAIVVFGSFFSVYGGVSQPSSGIIAAILDAKIVAYIFGFALIFSSVREPSRIFNAAFYAFILVGIVNTPFVFLDYARGVDLYGAKLGVKSGITLASGLFHAPTEQAWLYCLASFSSLCLFMQKRDPKFLLGAAAFSLLLVATLSVKEITGLLIGSVIIFRRSRRGWYDVVTKYAAVGGLAVVVVLTTDFGSALVKHVGMFVGSDAIPTVRGGMTEASWRIATEHFPFGSGGGTFGSAPSYQGGYSHVYYAYNIHVLHGGSRELPTFLQDVFWAKIIGEGGWLGFAAYASMLAILISRLVSGTIRSGNGGNVFQRFSLAIVILLVLVSLASSPFTNELLLLLTGLAFGYGSRFQPAASSWARNRGPRRTSGRGAG